MKLSRFIHVLDNNEIWNSLTREKIKLSDEQIEFISNNKDNKMVRRIPKDLKELGIFTSYKDELKLINKLAAETTDKQFQSLYLITTTSCNLDCSYCFYKCSSSQSLTKREFMDFDVAKKAVDEFYKIVKKNKINEEYWQQITFYGGEPTLNKNLLTKIIPYSREKFNDKYTSLVINTNLYYLDNELIELFKKNNVEVQVSLDGNKDEHDFYRKTADGKGSYDKVVCNIERLIKNQIKVLPMVTANQKNIKNFNEVLKDIYKKFNLKDFAVNIMITNSSEVGKDYPKELAKKMLEAYDDFGNLSNDYSFVDLYEMIISKNKQIPKNSCGATRKITVFPNGEVFACQALEKLDLNKMGKVSEPFIKNPNWLLWKKRNRFYDQECLSCKAVGVCGFGCAAGSYNGTGSIYGKDYNQCEYTKSLVDDLIKKKEN